MCENEIDTCHDMDVKWESMNKHHGQKILHKHDISTVIPEINLATKGRKSLDIYNISYNLNKIPKRIYLCRSYHLRRVLFVASLESNVTHPAS